jgi:tetratricopeptide (TPR) repeat protein
MNDEDERLDELLAEAEALETRGLRLDAMQVLRKATSMRKDPAVLTRIGMLATDLELWSEAETALKDAIVLESDFAPAYFYLGLLFEAQDRLEEALKALEAASFYSPSATNYTVLGVLQAKLDLIEEAQASCRKALAVDPQYEEAYYNLATTLDDKEQGILLLQDAIEIDANYALAHRELGRRLLTEASPEAEYHLRRAIELTPFDGWAHIYLGNLLWRSEDFNSAEAAFRKAIEVWPDRSVPYWCLAYFLEQRAKNQEAQKLYQKALEIDPGDAEANWRFGVYLKDVGDLEGARSYLLRAVCLNPANKRAATTLSIVENQLTPGSR